MFKTNNDWLCLSDPYLHRKAIKLSVPIDPMAAFVISWVKKMPTLPLITKGYV